MPSALGTRTLVIRGDRGLCRVHWVPEPLVIRGDCGLCRVHWVPEPLSQLCTRQLVTHAQRLSDGEFQHPRLQTAAEIYESRLDGHNGSCR